MTTKQNKNRTSSLVPAVPLAGIVGSQTRVKSASIREPDIVRSRQRKVQYQIKKIYATYSHLGVEQKAAVKGLIEVSLVCDELFEALIINRPYRTSHKNGDLVPRGILSDWRSLKTLELKYLDSLGLTVLGYQIARKNSLDGDNLALRLSQARLSHE